MRNASTAHQLENNQEETNQKGPWYDPHNTDEDPDKSIDKDKKGKI